MNENEKNEMGAESIVGSVDYHKKDYSRLPKAEVVSIHADGNKREGGKLTCNAYILMVKCNGKWRPENEWLHHAGLKTARRVYADTVRDGKIVKSGIEKAREAKEEILAKWGVAKVEKAKKAKEPTKAELAKSLAEAMVLIAKLRGEAKTEDEKQEELAEIAKVS